MIAYLGRSVVQKAVTLFFVSVVSFLIIHLAPGEPSQIDPLNPKFTPEMVERMRKEFNLDKPLLVQWWLFAKDAVRGDLGYSYVQKRPVTTLIAERLPATIELALGALFFGLLIAVPIGIISAVRQNSFLLL